MDFADSCSQRSLLTRGVIKRQVGGDEDEWLTRPLPDFPYHWSIGEVLMTQEKMTCSPCIEIY
jgi:hypothetical protein